MMAAIGLYSDEQPVHKANEKVAARTGRKTQAERSELTRWRVFEAVSDLIRLRGSSDLSTLEVAQRAGISRGALRHQFPTKDALIMATLHHLDETMLVSSRRRIAGVKNGLPVLESYISDAMDYFFGNYFFMVLSIGMSDERNHDLRVQTRLLYQTSRLAIERDWGRVLEESGLPECLAADVAALTLSVVRGFGVRRMIQDDAKRFQYLIDLWRKIIEDYIAGLTLREIGD